MTTWQSYPPGLGKCPWCSGANGYVIHNSGVCPKVKAIEYHPNGSIKRVEFKTEQSVGFTSPTNLPHSDESTAQEATQ